ncbi:MAG: right-handed parallel beta-helix repeat-containing protein [Ignavibacteria bacterium]|nr:right-handed parallel beta-helix repeat-containing protein [Ignavibacteria bacterium]
MKNLVGVTIALALIMSLSSSAERRYVSKTGNSTPPYTSWETAADSIMKVMRISGIGDTVIVGDGIYTEVVRFSAGVVLLGLGWDNTWIQIPQDSTTGIWMENDCSISNLKVVGWGMFEEFHTGIYSYRKGGLRMKIRIQNIKVSDCGAAIHATAFGFSNIDTVFVQNSVIDSSLMGFVANSTKCFVSNNYITTSENCIYFAVLSEVDVYNNILVAAPYNRLSDNFKITIWADNRPSRIHNNLIISLFPNVTEYSVGSELGPDTINNNVYIGNFGKVINTNGTSSYRDIFNNQISGGKYYGFNGESPLRFNNFWNNRVNWRSTGGASVDTISNITRFPMFADETKDYHLQAYSPLIDAGDTLVKDPDGTRSDIGMYGGRDGKSYTYLDLAPLEPRGIAATVAGDTIRIDWKRNHESDFKQYLVFGDTTQGFNSDSLSLIARTTDTSFTKIIQGFSGGYYLRLRSEDNQGNVSEESEEIRIIPVGITGEGHEVVQDYQLFNNYPNPFNPETVIGYRLKSPGRVILTVYTITGEPVRVLQDGEMPSGYHETKFRGDELASGIYLYKIDVRSPEGVPVYSSVRKMLLLK